MQSILDFEKQTSFSVTATVENKDGGKLVEMIEVVVENENEAPKVKSRYIANNSKMQAFCGGQIYFKKRTILHMC